jgi:hypothetical protein
LYLRVAIFLIEPCFQAVAKSIINQARYFVTEFKMTSNTSQAYLNGIGAWSDGTDFRGISLHIEPYISSNLSQLSNIGADLDGIGTWCNTADISTLPPAIVDSAITPNTSIPTRLNTSLANLELSLTQITQSITERCVATDSFQRFDLHQDQDHQDAYDALRRWISHDVPWFLMG